MNDGIEVSKIALLFFAKVKEPGKPLLAWPLYSFDPEVRIKELIEESDSWSKALGGKVVFTVKRWIRSENDLRDVLELSKEFDGVLIYVLTTSLDYGLFFRTVRTLNKPTIVFTEPYHCLAWPEIATLIKEGRELVAVSSSNRGDLIKALNVLDAYVRLRNTKVLIVSTPDEDSLEKLHRSEIYVGDRAYEEEYFRRVRELLRLEFVNYDEVLKIYESVSEEEAREIADSLRTRAIWVREGVRSEDLIKAVKLYLSIRKLLNEKGANAFAINDFTIMLKDLNALPTTPCVAITLLNDEGIPAACEADLNSLILQIIFKYLAGRPAWIADPVFDFNDNSVVYAHCTAPTRMRGYWVENEPYALDIHDETGKPVCVRTRMSVGEVVTIAQISSDFRKLMIRRTKIVEVPITDIACRTKVKTYAKDVKNMLWRYEPPLHRVLVYGDWLEELTYLAKLMGLEVVIEDG